MGRVSILFLCLFCHFAHASDEISPIHEFINLPKNITSSSGACVAIVENGFDQHQFDPSQVVWGKPTRSKEIFNRAEYERKIQDTIKNNILNTIVNFSNRSVKMITGKAECNLVEDGNLIHLELSYNSKAVGCEFNYELYFKPLSLDNLAIKKFKGESLNNNMLERSVSSDCASLYQDMLAFQEAKFQETYLEAQRHGNDVIHAFQSVAPNTKVKVYRVTELEEVAKDTDAKIVSISSFLLMTNFPNIFGMTFTPEEQDREFKNHIDQTYSCFKGTEKILTVALDNDHKEFSACRFNRVMSELANYAENNGFYLIPVGACALGGDNIMGSMSYLSDITPNLGEILKHCVTGPGFMVPVGGKVLNGSSIAAPIVAGAAIRIMDVYPTKTSKEIKTAIVESGRKKAFGAVFAPSRVEKNEFVKECLQVYPQMIPNLGLNSINQIPFETLPEEKFSLIFDGLLGFAMTEVQSLLNHPDEQKLFQDQAWSNPIIRKFIFNHFEINVLKKVWNHIDVLGALNYLEKNSVSALN